MLQAVEFNNISRADGSALMSLGDTVIQSAVYGPEQIRITKALSDKSLVEVSYRQKIGMSSCAEKLKEKHIRNAVETAILVALHPRSSTSIILQEIQDSGSLLACCINAACFALIDAGIPMRCSIAAVTAAVTSDDEIILYPSAKQEEAAKALLTFTFENLKMQTVGVATTGSFTEEQFNKSLNACKLAVVEVFTFYRESVKRRYSKESG